MDLRSGNRWYWTRKRTYKWVLLVHVIWTNIDVRLGRSPTDENTGSNKGKPVEGPRGTCRWDGGLALF